MANQTALLVIDVQNAIIAGDEPSYHSEVVLRNIAHLLEQARASKTPIVFIQHTEPNFLDEGSAGWEIHPQVAPQPDEPVFGKRACDSFFETPLQAELEQRGIQHLIIAGCQTNYCIDTTTRRAITLGYNVTLVGDAHSTTDHVLPAEQIVAYHNAVLNGFGVLDAKGGVRYMVQVKPTTEVAFPS
jgi:nicotinamidase-related amidase